MRTRIAGLTILAASSLFLTAGPGFADDAPLPSGTVASNDNVGSLVETQIAIPNTVTPASSPSEDNKDSSQTADYVALDSQNPLVKSPAKLQTVKKVKKGNSFLRRMLEPVTDLQSQSLKLQEQIVKLERPIEGLQPPMYKLQERVLSVESQLSEVQKNLSGVRDELKSVHGTISGVSTQITRLEQPIGALHEPVSRLYQPISNLAEPLGDLHNQLGLLRSQMTTLQKPVSSLNAPIVALNKPVSDLVTPVKQLHEPLQQLQSELGDLKFQLADLKGSINRIGVYLLVAISLTGLFAAIGIPVAIFLAWSMFSKRGGSHSRPEPNAEADYQRLEKDLAVKATK